MVARLWFSICALAAVLAFALGAVGVLVYVVEDGFNHSRPIDWGAVLLFGLIGFLGPLICRFIYRWGLWVAGTPSRG